MVWTIPTSADLPFEVTDESFPGEVSEARFDGGGANGGWDLCGSSCEWSINVHRLEDDYLLAYFTGFINSDSSTLHVWAGEVRVGPGPPP